MKQNKVPRIEYSGKEPSKFRANHRSKDRIVDGLVFTDPRGQWAHPGQITEIPGTSSGTSITMDGVNYPVQGVDDTGYSQMMYPGMDYQFPGNYVTEYPMANAKYGGGLPKAQKGKGIENEKDPIEHLKWGKYIDDPKRREQHIIDVYQYLMDSKWDPEYIPNFMKKEGAYGSKNRGDIAKKGADWGWDSEDITDEVLAKAWDDYYNNRKVYNEQAYGGDPSLTNIEGHYQNGGSQTPEEWEKEIRTVESKIGDPSTWTLDSHKILQDKLNEYKAWREGTEKGKAVVDYHNEPNEYVVPLPDHLKDPNMNYEKDLISKVLMNRNKDKDFVKRAYDVGAYPDSNMFTGLDTEDFGNRMSHKMSWGEDDSGQAYMYPDIYNPNNEAIKVPNQYADYISSEGYKKATGMIPERPFGGQNTKTHTHMAQGGWLDEYDEGGSKIKNKLSKNTLAKEQRSNQDNTRVSNLPIKTLQALQQQADVEKASRQQYKQQPVISQGKQLTPEEQAYSDKVQARIANPSNDLGIIGANMASALTRFKYLNPEEIAATTNNPMGTVGLSSDIMTQALANEMVGPAFKEAFKNTYRINPWAEKLNNVNSSYRVAGLDAAKDFKNTGILRSVQKDVPKGASLIERAMSRPTSFPSFQKGYADLRYLPDEGGVVFKTDLPTFKRGDINPVTGFPIKGRHYAHRVIDPKTGAAITDIPGADVKMYGSEPHWLKGYQEVPVELPGSPNKKSISTNLEDLAYAKKWAKQYGYELPKNLERIAKSDELTNKTIRGLMNRHNSFTRGVSTNWDELGKKNPKVLEYLNDVGIDYVNNPKAAAEYMATHIPGETGYGRYGLKEGENALYLSNSNPTAEGYTYGQGYTVKVKKPTDFSSANRKDWVTNNEFFANKGFKGSEYGTGIVKNDYIRRIPIGLRQTLAATGNPNKMSDLQKIVQGKEELYNDLAHQSWKKYNNLIDDLKYKTSAETRNKFLRWGDEGVEEGLKDAPNLFDKLQLKYLKNKKNLMQNYYHVLPLKDLAKGVYGDSDVWKALGKNMFGKIDPFSHYAIKGQPGEKVLEAINFKEIKPELWNNKSRAHINLSSKGLTRRKNGGWLDDMDDEYRRGGQKKKKYTSKNIQSSVNDIFTRNETLFGPAGRKRYKPGLKYQDGGNWLDKYQDTGEVIPKDDPYQNKEFLIDMTNSPLFNERYSKMTGSDNLSEAEVYKNNIINNINNVKYETNPKILNRHNAEGMYMPKNHTIYKNETEDDSTNLHELSHASTKGNKYLSKDQIKNLKNRWDYNPSYGLGMIDEVYANVNKPEAVKDIKNAYKVVSDNIFANNKSKKYYTNPSEIKARVDVGRKLLSDKGLYDPINQKFTEENYNSLKNNLFEDKGFLKGLFNTTNSEYTNDIYDLLNNYSKEDVIRMFNEIVTNKPKQQPVAKMGGNWLDNLH